MNLYLEKQQDNITIGHTLKLVNNRYHYDLRKFSFAPRIVNVWNSLPEIVNQPLQQTLSKEDYINFGNTRIYYMIIRLS